MRAARDRRHLLAGRRQRHRPDRAVHRPGRRELRDDRLLRRQRRLPALRRRHAVRRPLLPCRRGDGHTRPAPATARAPASRRRRSPACPSPATRPRVRRASRSAPATPTARPGTSATRALVGSSASARSAPPAPNAAAATASTASAARPRAAAPARSATLAGARALVSPYLPATPIRTAAARRRTRRAASTGPATATAPAARARSAPAAARRPAAGRPRQRRSAPATAPAIVRRPTDELRRLRLRHRHQRLPHDVRQRRATAPPATPASRLVHQSEAARSDLRLRCRMSQHLLHRAASAARADRVEAASPARCRGRRGLARRSERSPTQPHVCTDQTAASCGTNGLCDGAGHCASYPVGTSCAAAGCHGLEPQRRSDLRRRPSLHAYLRDRLHALCLR